ncbi:hypothetical protein CFC21_082329 [Triticum aestivum]|uniref:Uncharacterized protein n=2 Tax=Triticum aestivum TaxID=4565 RepID=A0A9R1I572_WHEAT|nr:hypothetical protein CFC21_082329 [Triticum aestivum]
MQPRVAFHGNTERDVSGEASLQLRRKLHCSSGEASLQPRRSPFRPYRCSNDRAELPCSPEWRFMATPSATSPAKLHCNSGESFIAASAESVPTPSQLQRPGGAPWQPRVALQCNLNGVKISSNTAPPSCGVAAPAPSSARLRSSCFDATAATALWPVRPWRAANCCFQLAAMVVRPHGEEHTASGRVYPSLVATTSGGVQLLVVVVVHPGWWLASSWASLPLRCNGRGGERKEDRGKTCGGAAV